MNNPFSNIKAVHLNNNEIVNFWVNIKNNTPDKKDLLKIIEPDNPRPFIILGGKGSGKTHILRFCSYSAQKVRALKENHNIITQLQEEKYTSVLLEFGNFQFERFSGSKLENSIWSEWYFYYFNIILIEAFLEQIIDLQENGLNDIDDDKISNMYNEYFFDEINEVVSLKQIYLKIKKEHKKIDKAFSKLRTGIINTIDLDVIFDTRSNIFYDICYYTLQASETLKNIRLLYLLDQFEDLSKEQQKFVNTIIRHPKYTENISIRIAGRLYSIKEQKTFSDDEKNSYAEVTIKYLETYMDDSKSYKQFSVDLINKRINKNDSNNLSYEYLVSSFNDFDENTIFEKITLKHPQSKDRKYFINLQTKLNKYKDTLKLNDEEILTILENLYFPLSPLKEKENIWLLFQAWSKKENLINKSIEIKQSSNNEGKNIHNIETLKHLKDTFYFQLCRDYNIVFYQCGFNKVLDFSHANPRNFMLILREVYSNAEFTEQTIFDSNNPISCQTQNKSIKDASNEFWKYAIIDIENNAVVKMIERINSFFKVIRMSDKPTEKTLISFSYIGDLSQESKQILTDAVNHMLLIRKGVKKEKNNSGSMLDIYSVPAMLTAKWDLPIAKGGTFQFLAEDIEVLCSGSDREWTKIYKQYISRYNVPFKDLSSNKETKQKISFQTPSLFEEDL